MPVSKLDTAVRRAAADQRITKAEAKTLVKEAKASGSKKPIDDVFKAIDRTDASVAAGATRHILSELDQKMTRAEWVKYAQKAASPAGLWGPGSEGGKKVSRDDLPPALKKTYDSWLKGSPEDTPSVVSIDVAGKPAYLMQQYTEFGTGFGLFDANGKSIELKEDTKNVQREAKRIQSAYDQHFGAPEMRAWKDSVQHTDLGVIRNYYHSASELSGSSKSAVMKGELKRIVDEQKADVGRRDVETRIFKHKSNGSLLVITQSPTGVGPEHFALFSKQGALVKRFEIDV